MTDQI